MNDERCKQHDYPLRRCDGCVKYAKECLRSTMSEECTKKIDQARALERKKCQATYANLEDIYKTQFDAGYKKGQADLICKMGNILWAHPSFTGTLDDAEEILKDAQKILASESLVMTKESLADVPADETQCVSNLKPEKLEWIYENCNNGHDWLAGHLYDECQRCKKRREGTKGCKKSYSIFHSNKSCEITHAINCIVCDCSCHERPKGLMKSGMPVGIRKTEKPKRGKR